MPKTISRGKPKKNHSLELLRSVSDMLAEAIGIDKEIPSHTLSGLSSQYMGVDPETGEVGETAWRNIKRNWNSHERRKAGLPREKHVLPGIVTDTLSLPNTLGTGPEWSKKFQRDADDTHDLVRHSMSLEAPHGFQNMSADAAGTILGQLPIPAKGGKAVGRTLKDFLLAVPEYLSPTTEARLGNYVTGGLGVGALDHATRSPGFQGFMQSMLMPDEIPQDPRIQLHDEEGTGDYAKGGKAQHLTEILRTISMNPGAKATRESRPYQIGDPLEEVLYAARQGVETGKMSEAERRSIIETLSQQENEEQLEATLTALHAKLFPGKAMPEVYPTVPVIGNARAPKGHGLIPSEAEPLELPPQFVPSRFDLSRGPVQETMSPDQFSDQDWNKLVERRMKVRKAKGGKISGLMGLREKLAEAARVSDEMPTTAGVKSGNELVPVLQTNPMGPPEFNADLLKQVIPGKPLANSDLRLLELGMPKASRREVLQGIAGALSPIDVPISAEGLAKTLAKKALTKGLEPKADIPKSSIYPIQDIDDTLSGNTDFLESFGDPEQGIESWLGEASPNVLAAFKNHGFFLDENQIHYDPKQRHKLEKIISEITESHGDSTPGNAWERYDLGGDDDVDYNGGYLRNALDSLDHYHNKLIKDEIFGASDSPDWERAINLIERMPNSGPVLKKIKEIRKWEGSDAAGVQDDNWDEATRHYTELEDLIDKQLPNGGHRTINPNE